jgi:hypothetical protein
MPEISDEKLEYYRSKTDEIVNDVYKNLESKADATLSNFTDFIKNDHNFTIVRFHDGEFRCMIATDEQEHNCDGNYYYKAQGLELIKAYVYFLQAEDVSITRWASHTYSIQDAIEKDYQGSFDKESKFVYSDLLTHKLPFRPKLVEFFRAIKNSKRKKLYISNYMMLNALKAILNLDFGCSIPEVNCYLERDEVLEGSYKLLEHTGANDNIVLVSAGMFSEIIIMHLHKRYPNNTYIDIGSTFDGLIKFSRDYNKSFEYGYELISTYYKYIE